MSIRALDNNDDWTFGNNQNNYLNGLEEIKQDVTTRIRSFKNDWFLDTEAHIDWIRLLGLKNNESQIKQELKKTILSVEGVTAIDSIKIENNENRRADITIELRTIYDDNNLILSTRI